jgi:hypothetical protein
MAAVKSIKAVDDRLMEITQEMAEEFSRQHPTHPLAVESTVLSDTRRRLSAINGEEVPNISRGSGTIRKKRTGRGKQPNGKVSQLEAAYAAVRAAKKPLTTAELVTALPEHGATPSANNPEGNLTSVVSKRGDLESIRWRGKRAWWFKGQDAPE